MILHSTEIVDVISRIWPDRLCAGCLQIVYILDQVKAMEKAMCARIEEQGLDHSPEIIVITRLIPKAKGTSCDQALEPINGTKHSRIVRVPFKTKDGKDLQEWVSRSACRTHPFLCSCQMCSHMLTLHQQIRSSLNV